MECRKLTGRAVPDIDWPVIKITVFVLGAAFVVGLLSTTEPSNRRLEKVSVRSILQSNVSSFRQAAEQKWSSQKRPCLNLGYDGPQQWRDVALTFSKGVNQGCQERPDTSGHLLAWIPEDRQTVTIELAIPGSKKPILEKTEGMKTPHWSSLLPPLVAVGIALIFRHLLFALGAAVWLGAALQTSFEPLRSTQRAVRDYLVGPLTEPFSLYIIGFTFALVGMVQVIIRMGGIRGLLETFSSLARSARSTRVATVLVGMFIFFDDYANTIVAGSTMRPLTDRHKVSREKLAYLVDSTSAPIAGLALISTWIGYEVGLFQQLADQLNMGMSGYDIFLNIVALRFYCLFTILFVVLNAVAGRDFGPMYGAEWRAAHTGQVLRPNSEPLTDGELEGLSPPEGIPHRWYNAVIPITLVIASALLGLYWSGWRAGGEAIPSLFSLTDFGAVSIFFERWIAAGAGLISLETWREAFGEANSAKVLFIASVIGTLASFGLAIGQRLLTFEDVAKTWARTFRMMALAVTILVLAWAIQAVCTDLQTGLYLVALTKEQIAVVLLPVLTFALGAIMAFATGSSWGTMGILLPAIIPLAYEMTRGIDNGELLVMLCFGAVLDGAIFGDHCSPISDTTVMSSIASSVDHIDHVRTQIPYALTSSFVAAGFGYLGVAVGLSWSIATGLGAVSLIGVFFSIGQDPRDNDTKPHWFNRIDFGHRPPADAEESGGDLVELGTDSYEPN
jgi:Na+/H+ antiporter NhaC